VIDLILKPTEQLLNRSLHLSTQAQDLANQLQQKSIAVSVQLHPESEPFRVRVAITDHHVTVKADQEPASVNISGSPTALLKFTSFEWAKALSGSARIEGDAEVAKQFEQFFKVLPLDGIGLLAEKIGDRPAYWVDKAARKGLSAARYAARALSRQSLEYLTEEAAVLPIKTRVDLWMQDVESVRDSAQRLQARLNLLERRIKS